jgi:hypothetical protein
MVLSKSYSFPLLYVVFPFVSVALSKFHLWRNYDQSINDIPSHYAISLIVARLFPSCLATLPDYLNPGLTNNASKSSPCQKPRNNIIEPSRSLTQIDARLAPGCKYDSNT